MDDIELLDAILEKCGEVDAHALAKAYIEKYGLLDNAAFNRLHSAAKKLLAVEETVQRYRDCVPGKDNDGPCLNCNHGSPM